jgi:hypothetical protein
MRLEGGAREWCSSGLLRLRSLPARSRSPAGRLACRRSRLAPALRERVIHLLHILVLLEFVDELHDFGGLLFGEFGGSGADVFVFG